MHKSRFFLLTILLLVISFGHVGAHEDTDMLVYMLDNSDGKPSLMLYDTATGISTTVISEMSFIWFSISTDSHIAFSSNTSGNTEIYVLNRLTPHQSPINITQTPDIDENPYVLMWSPDGHYLAFESFDKNNHALIYLWDGETSHLITPQGVTDPIMGFDPLWSRDGRYLALLVSDKNNHPQIYVWDGSSSVNITPQDMIGTARSIGAVWSPDGYLAFNVRYGINIPSEIYLWNGFSTVNLSQSPDRGERDPVWSANGQVAFQSEHNGEYTIRVWDGVSFKNGVPDKDSFANVAPGMIGSSSNPTWTSEGYVAFISQSMQDTHTQVYVWDGKKATNISQNPTAHNGTPVWSRDGHWAFATFFSSSQLLYVRDERNRIVLTTEGQNRPAWSLDGDLAFCRFDRDGWILSVWDGKTITQLAKARGIEAKWQSGENVACSSNG